MTNTQSHTTARHKKIWATLDPFYESGIIMGRSVANREFLRALLRIDPFDEYHFFLPDHKTIDKVQESCTQEFPHLTAQKKIHYFSRTTLPQALSRTPYYCFHLSDCITHPANLASLRNTWSQELFPITATTHSLSYRRYAGDFLAHLWPGVTRRDCTVASSVTAKKVVQQYYDFLREGYSLEQMPSPEVAIVPLGVDTQSMRPATPQERKAAREALRIDKQHMLLVFARISYHSKMDLLPVLRAIQRVKRQGVDSKQLVLVIAGWLEAGSTFPEMIQELAANIDLRCECITCPDDAMKQTLFHAADTFLSPADNPQETFGLSILEAGAYGLPAIASDYDGYRDLVVQNHTGLLVSVTGPEDTCTIDGLAPVLFDSESHLLLAQQTAVDVPELASAITYCVKQQEQAKAMGRNARHYVEATFTWDHTVQKHCQLWDLLWKNPVDPVRPGSKGHPLHTPYSRLFGSYCSRVLDGQTRLVWSQAGKAVYRRQENLSLYEGISHWVSPDVLRQLLFFAHRARRAEDIVAHAGPVLQKTPQEMYFLLNWALKHDLLERVVS